MALFSDEVAAGVRAGSPDAVGTVYVALADRLLSYLMARVRDLATAEDLLELTFLELLQKGRTIRGGPAAIKVWLFRAAHYNALDHLRKARRRLEDPLEQLAAFDVVDPAAGPEELALADDVSRRVRSAMRQLSEDQRQVLLLRYVADLSAQEVAGVLNKTDGAVRSLQHRGERSLARILNAQAQAAAASAPLRGTSKA
ncbi:MAG TPA: sigma-70 family RNA polymerase sigma factor [Egibacteraceae bacterium]|nr:sigma-70 family RNA polymerase sigma factor [Actinomycetota bacterium]HWB72611.1 sigma-70 family RNA polymerase sigma factor [Egibacteraceae bacterium]